MCGIAGFNWEDDTLLRQMARATHHRGPDATGFFTRGGKVSLAHNRLSILDLHERSNQPLFYNHEGREYVLVFNGEIYNYSELKRDLERAGCRFQTKTDSEIILAAYAMWGPGSVRRFNGMWAFALFDEKANVLFLSRDRFGKKPLYYYHSDSRFLFASEIKAIVACSKVARRADRERVADLLNYGLASHTDGTFFQGVRQLPAGTSGTLDLGTGRWTIERYYTIPRADARATDDRIRATLRAAVDRRLISDVPICLSLSGGVDSSAIAALVAESHDDRMVAFTTISQEGPGDETANVMKLLNVYKQFELIKVPLTKEHLAKNLEAIVHHMDEPFIYDSPFVRWKIAEAIHRHGFKVAVTGEGADELLGGYPMASHLFLRDLLRRRAMPRLAFELAFNFLQPDWRMILSLFLSQYRRTQDERVRHHFLDFARRLGVRLPPGKEGANLTEGDISLKEKLYSQVTTFFLPYLLACNDKMYMAHAVEARAPFLDVEVAELFLGIATERLIVRGIRKYPLRRAMRRRVPSEVLFDRRKIGFASPVRLQLGTPEAKSWIRGLFTDARTAAYLDPKAFLSELDALPAGAEVPNYLMHALTLEMWMRQFDVAAD
jgi:asparagine synthase (glutamine-hydrolysing)